jgi:hypothetical protein
MTHATLSASNANTGNARRFRVSVFDGNFSSAIIVLSSNHILLTQTGRNIPVRSK